MAEEVVVLIITLRLILHSHIIPLAIKNSEETALTQIHIDVFLLGEFCQVALRGVLELALMNPQNAVICMDQVVVMLK